MTATKTNGKMSGRVVKGDHVRHPRHRLCVVMDRRASQRDRVWIKGVVDGEVRGEEHLVMRKSLKRAPQMDHTEAAESVAAQPEIPPAESVAGEVSPVEPPPAPAVEPAAASVATVMTKPEAEPAGNNDQEADAGWRAGLQEPLVAESLAVAASIKTRLKRIGGRDKANTIDKLEIGAKLNRLKEAWGVRPGVDNQFVAYVEQEVRPYRTVADWCKTAEVFKGKYAAAAHLGMAMLVELCREKMKPVLDRCLELLHRGELLEAEEIQRQMDAISASTDVGSGLFDDLESAEQFEGKKDKSARGSAARKGRATTTARHQTKERRRNRTQTQEEWERSG